VNISPEAYAHKVQVLAEHCERESRDPATIRRSMMVFGMVGPTPGHIERALRVRGRMFGMPADADLQTFQKTLRERGSIVGGTDEIVDALGRLAEHGLEEVQFQHFDFDSDDVPEYLARDVAPQVANL
jgi:alkanesulfonate monooxygenase SsuD/methylene tetrahydromethanopterin reductase-like flavin-dependent oxidoreductase (luciferase family)